MIVGTIIVWPKMGTGDSIYLMKTKSMANTENTAKATLLLFTANPCSVCHAIEPKIKALLQATPDIELQIIDIEAEPQLCARHMVFTAPVLIIQVNEKEQHRFQHSFSIREVEHKLHRIIRLME